MRAGLRALTFDAQAAVEQLRRGTLRTSPRAAVRLGRALARGRRDLWLGIEGHAAARPDEIAVEDERGRRTWSELDAQARAVAAWLERGGVGRRDRVVVALPNRIEWIVAAAACARVGAAFVPLSPHSPPDALAARLRETGAKAVVVTPALAAAAPGVVDGAQVAVIDDAPVGSTPWDAILAAEPTGGARRSARTRRDDGPDLVLFTSGTTGRSKGARISAHRAGIRTALRYLHAFDLDRSAVLLTPCPLYHAAPLLLAGLVLTVGGRLILRQRLDRPVDDLVGARATHAFLVPTLLERLSRMPTDELQRLRRGPLRALLSSGAALRPALKRTLQHELGPVLYDFYGATELGVVAVAGPAELAWDPTTVGRVLPGVEVRLVGDDGEPAPPGAPGLLEVRAASVSDGYLSDARGDDGGWRTAGDICRLVDGLLYVVDRKRDVVITGGVNVFPIDVEEQVEAHPSIREAAAVGVPDLEWGEALHVFVVLEDGAALDPEALIAHCRARLAPAAVPKALHAVDALPRSLTGKVLRRELRDRVSAEATPQPAVP